MVFGHVRPKYALDSLNKAPIEHMIERTLDGVQRAVLDKWMKSYERKTVTVTLKHLGLDNIIEKK